VENWPLMSSPLPTIGIVFGYIFVVILGMQIMKHQKPFNLKPIIILHNAILVALSGYICVETLHQALFVLDYGFTFNAVDYTSKGLPLAKVFWLFYFSKALEFFDTFIMVLRKKNDQITFLHIYHHALTFGVWWIGMRFVAGGEAYVSVVQNCFVHVVMYSYYLLSAIGFRDVWWKRYLTQLQMTQFFINIIHVCVALYLDSPYPRWMGWAMLSYMASLLILFGNFYIQAYLKKRRLNRSQVKEKAE